MQKFCKNFTQGKKIFTQFLHILHIFLQIFLQIYLQKFLHKFLHNFYTEFTQFLHTSRGLKSLCKFEKCKFFAKILHRGKKNFYTIFTHFAKNFAKIFAHIFTQFLHTILHKFCTFFTTAHFANFFAPQTTWRVRYLPIKKLMEAIEANVPHIKWYLMIYLAIFLSKDKLMPNMVGFDFLNILFILIVYPFTCCSMKCRVMLLAKSE